MPIHVVHRGKPHGSHIFSRRWIFLLILCFAFGFEARPQSNDPYLVKEYPDGTRVKVRWSQVNTWEDVGNQHGGPPKIRPMTEDEESLPEEVVPPNAMPKKKKIVQETIPSGSNESSAAATKKDIKVLKIYPDGSRVVASWASLGNAVDQGEGRGGPPQIIPYDANEATTSSLSETKKPNSQENTSSTRADASSRPVKENEVLGSEISGGFPSTFSRGMGPSLQYGQAFQDYGPSMLRSGPLPPSLLPRKEFGLPEGPDEKVTMNLIGVAFLGKPEEVRPEGMSQLSGVKNTVPGLPPEVARGFVQPYMGKAVTLRDLNGICRQISSYFEENQQPVVSAVVPQQEIRGGVVQVLVVRGKMGEVRVEGNQWFETENLKKNIRTPSGEDLNLGTLTDDVAWMNNNPFRQVQPSLTPGEKPGQTDVVLDVKDRFPVRPFASVDNFGVQSLGYNRFSTGFTVGDVWTGWDQQFNYQFLMSGSDAQLLSNSGSYTVALPWQHSLNIFGTYSKADPNASGAYDQSGYYWQTSMRYNIPLPTLSLLEGLDYRHQTYFGYDYKVNNTDIFFQGQAISSTFNGFVGTYSISQFVFGYSLNMVDPLGSTAFETVLFGSPGGMGSNNSNSAFQQINGGAEAQYIYGKFSLNRLFRLPGDASVLLTGQIQQANTNLMPSESFGIGGYDTVRGYDQRAANGDNGYLGNIEFRSPPISFWQMAGEAEALDQMVFLAFLDYGQVLQYSPDSVTSENWHLMSIGPGMRYNIGPYFSLRFDWGFQLQQAPPGTTGGVGGRSGTSQAVLSATLAY